MKRIYQYTWLLVIGTATMLSSCEENDPLGDLGIVKGDKVPYVTISGMESIYPAKDTIVYNAIYWTVEDDIDKLELYKSEQVTLSGSLSVDDGAGAITVEFNEVIETEMVQEGEAIEHDPMDYVTSRNAYTKRMEYIIPAEYQLLELKDETMLADIEKVKYAEDLKTIILDELATNGIVADWDDLAGIATAVGLKIESNLNFQMRVYNAKGYNDSAARKVIVDAIEE